MSDGNGKTPGLDETQELPPMPSVTLPDGEIVQVLTDDEFRSISEHFATATPQEVKRLWATNWLQNQMRQRADTLTRLYGRAIITVVWKHGNRGMYGIPAAHLQRVPEGAVLDFAVSKQGDFMFGVQRPPEQKIVIARDIPKGR